MKEGEGGLENGAVEERKGKSGGGKKIAGGGGRLTQGFLLSKGMQRIKPRDM